MAKVLVDADSVDIRVSLLERVMLAEKPMRLPLSRIRGVDPHPRLLDMMVHWADQSSAWLCGVSAYDGHLIPSAKNPAHMLAIELDDAEERIFVEIDDEPTDQVAARIEHALRRLRGASPEITPAPVPTSSARDEIQRLIAEDARRRSVELEAMTTSEDDEDAEDLEDIRLRDPLMQGSLPPPPPAALARAAEEESESAQTPGDHELARLGGWLVAVGSVGVLSGTTIVAAGMVPGLLAVGAGIACGVLGGVALAVVSSQQSESD